MANFFRISLQIGWNYATVLKYQNDPMDFINYVSGKARMSLANLVFRTFNISSKQVTVFVYKCAVFDLSGIVWRILYTKVMKFITFVHLFALFD